MEKLTGDDLVTYIFDKGPFTRQELKDFTPKGLRHYVIRMTRELDALGKEEFEKQSREDPTFKEFGQEALDNEM